MLAWSCQTLVLHLICTESLVTLHLLEFKTMGSAQCSFGSAYHNVIVLSHSLCSLIGPEKFGWR